MKKKINRPTPISWQKPLTVVVLLSVAALCFYCLINKSREQSFSKEFGTGAGYNTVAKVYGDKNISFSFDPVHNIRFNSAALPDGIEGLSFVTDAPSSYSISLYKDIAQEEQSRAVFSKKYVKGESWREKDHQDLDNVLLQEWIDSSGTEYCSLVGMIAKNQKVSIVVIIKTLPRNSSDSAGSPEELKKIFYSANINP